MPGSYLKVYTSLILGWGAYSYDIHGFYIKPDDNIKDEYFICTDPNDATVKYYYIPTAFSDITYDLVNNDPSGSGAYETTSTFPGSGTPLSSINITSWVPPTSRDTYGFGVHYPVSPEFFGHNQCSVHKRQ